MVTGHLSTAYLARRYFARAEIFALLAASILPDLADFVLPQGNQCRTACGMYTHAFPAVLVLAGAASMLSWAIWHRRATSILVGALVILHVVFDFFTGYKPYWIGGPPIGLALFRFHLLDFIVESLMVLTAWVLLRRLPDPPRVAVSYAALFAMLAVQAAFDVWMQLAFG